MRFLNMKKTYDYQREKAQLVKPSMAYDVLVCGGRSDGGFFGPACGYATGCPANKRCYDS